jgi:UDP-N-acetylmuramyl pentapeptide synthase
MKALTPEQSELFQALVSGEYDNFLLASSQFQGQDVAVIAAYADDGETFTMHPVAILIDTTNEDFFMDALVPPDDDFEEVEAA